MMDLDIGDVPDAACDAAHDLARDLALAHEENSRLVPSLDCCKQLWKSVGCALHGVARYGLCEFRSAEWLPKRDEKWHEYAYWTARVLQIYNQHAGHVINTMEAISAIARTMLDVAPESCLVYDLLSRWMGTEWGCMLSQQMHTKLGVAFWNWKVRNYSPGNELEAQSKDSALQWARVCVATGNYSLLGLISNERYGALRLSPFLQALNIRTNINIQWIRGDPDFIVPASGRMTKGAY